MENTVSVSEGQGTVEQTQPVAPQQVPVLPVDKEELKSLLHEVVTDIHEDKSTVEAAKVLRDEFNAAKNEFLVFCQRIEEELKKMNKHLG